MRQFNVGQVVTCIPDRFLRHAAPGDYKIIAAMPDQDGDRIEESRLVASDGYLPEELPKRSSRHRTITLPTLRVC